MHEWYSVERALVNCSYWTQKHLRCFVRGARNRPHRCRLHNVVSAHRMSTFIDRWCCHFARHCQNTRIDASILFTRRYICNALCLCKLFILRWLNYVWVVHSARCLHSTFDVRRPMDFRASIYSRRTSTRLRNLPPVDELSDFYFNNMKFMWV